MFAAPIKVEACLETDIGAIVPGYDRTRSVPEEDGLGARLLGLRLPRLRLDLDLLEAVPRVVRRPATNAASLAPFFHRLIIGVSTNI
jgi:hypothetical protein